MLITDPIGDMLARIKNAQLAKHEQVTVPHSKIKEALAKILKENNYIEDYEVKELNPQNDLVIKVKYVEGLPGITGASRVSKPGCRLYAKSSSIPATLNGYGITIISTSKGVMTDKEARQQNVGGELLCKIW